MSERTAIAPNGMLDRAFVSEQQSGAAVYAMSAMTFYSATFPVAKCSMYSACPPGGEIGSLIFVFLLLYSAMSF